MSSTLSDHSTRGVRDFLTTRWSVVLSARGDTTHAPDALAKLCHAYWYPLYAYVRRQGVSSHDAQDLTQEFFARQLAKGWLADVERERGRFRSWLLASLKHFLANEWDKARAQKRGGGGQFISIDDTAESRYDREPADAPTAESLYDRRWALTLLDRVLTRLREEFAVAGKIEQFEILKGVLAGDRTPYVELAAALGTTEGAVKVAVHRLRGRYRDLIRAEIAETVSSAAELEEELRHLLGALG
jgi:RNA polymerase sigma-70 factor (ECF subfamily)